MFGLNLFIAGIEKSGTTSLAEWFVANGLATYSVPGIKEPYSYAAGEVSVNQGFASPRVFLDASVGYSFNPTAIARMPEHNTRIILCLRNHFDRCFSAYKFFKIIARRDRSSAALLETTPRLLDYEIPDKNRSNFLFEMTFEIVKLHFHAKSEVFVRKYFLEQAENISRQSFRERIDYEIGFFLSRRQFPFFSILNSGFLQYPLKNILSKYKAEDVFLLTLNQLDNEQTRAEFVKDLLGERARFDNLPPVSNINTTLHISSPEKKPNFRDSDWDFLRQYFHHDLAIFQTLANDAGVSLKYVNLNEMNRNVADI